MRNKKITCHPVMAYKAYIARYETSGYSDSDS
ncbi:MAG: hypothetical protein KatS3mg130_0847 [Candidatus Sumerlaea sp.]|nr:MAG: hypothetical protein KatS3mg130_0847 [Candidatus Sumerlaea sp.]